MPSASNKLEKQASLEVSEPFKVVLSVIEKKVRNLEKRKAKLDTLKAQTGELHDQQKEALTRYEEVVNTLEFSRDLMKNITHISLEAAKNQKKQAKRELLEQQARELQRVKELLILNSVLSSMGEEKTRQDFKAGVNGATVLTEEELERLDNLFKLVTPCRTSEEENVAPFGQQLTSAAEHVVAILDGKKKDVLGSTYANLRELIFGIHQCEYFKSQEEKEAVNGGDNRVGVESETEQVISEEKPVNEVVAAATEVGEEKICGVETSVEVASVTAAVAAAGGETFQSEDNSVFSTFTHNKPYTEVFTSAQGSFNFLQESQIDPDSPHMDPAVVAAHPMVPPASVRTNFAGVGGQPAGELLSQQFPNQVNEVVLNSNSSANIPQSHYIQPVPAITATHLQDFSQIPTQTYTNQHYVAVPTFAAPIYSTQAVAPPPNVAATTAANKLSGEEGNWISESKKHFMNVNATAFESISYKGGVTGGVGAAVEESSGEVNTPPDSANNEVNEDRHKFSSNDNFQSANQGNYQARNGGYNYRGGPRGTGSGGRGLRGMNNGYSGRGGGGRGGNFNNNGRGGGGGGGSNNYQGNFRDNNYNNYQRENFNNGYNGTNNGGGGGSRRGAGGASNINRGSRGGGGGNVSRGGNSSRGGGGGNFTKAAA